MAAGELDERADVLGRGAAAAAEDVHPALGEEALDLPDEELGRLVVASFLVGKAGVREARDREARDLRQRAQVVGHEIRDGRAVHSYLEEVATRDRAVGRLERLPREHRACLLDIARE